MTDLDQIKTETEAVKTIAARLHVHAAGLAVGERFSDEAMETAMDAGARVIYAQAAQIAGLEAERDRLKAALTLIERLYYMEAKAVEWRAAKMNGCARDAQNGEELAQYYRLFPRKAIGGEHE